MSKLFLKEHSKFNYLANITNIRKRLSLHTGDLAFVMNRLRNIYLTGNFVLINDLISLPSSISPSLILNVLNCLLHLHIVLLGVIIFFSDKELCIF